MIKKIEKNGRIEWRLNGKLHREDGPAIEFAHGEKQWYLNGELHRIDGPAIEWTNGSKQWYLNGKIHRKDGPAVELSDCTKEWWLNGKIHRKDGPAVEYADGSIFWLSGGKYHREDGPAVDYANGQKEWWVNSYKINYIKLDLTRKYINCIGQFLYNKNIDYLILCFERDTHYFYTVLWKYVKIEGKRFDYILEELKSLL